MLGLGLGNLEAAGARQLPSLRSLLNGLSTSSASQADAAAVQLEQRDWADDSNFLPDPAAPQLGPEDADKPVPASQRQRLEPAPRQHRQDMRRLSHRHGVDYSMAALPPAHQRTLTDYQYLAGSVSAARRSFLLRDIYEEMALNGVPPDAFFLETAVEYCMRTSRVGDCFYFYNELLRRGMQPRARLKGHLVSVLARAGRIRAATDLFKEFQPDKDESSFQLHLALINIVHVHGEEGDVAGVRAQMASFLEKYGDKEENAVSYAYVALLKALRKMPGARDAPGFAQEVVQAAAEGQARAQAAAAKGLASRKWQIPVNALFALQKNGCHAEAVALFEAMDEEDKVDPDSWAYTHVVMSYMKDGMGAFRWPRSEAALRERLKHHFALEQEGISAERAAAASAAAAGAGEPAGSDERLSESESDAEEGSAGEHRQHGETGSDWRAKQLPSWVPRSEFSRLRFKALAEYANLASWNRALELHAEMRSRGLELPASEMLELIEASMQMEAMGFKGCIAVGVGLLDFFRSRGDESQRYINPNTAQQLFRFAMQKTVGDLSLAHKLWDMLVAQGDTPAALLCRNYASALQHREPQNVERIAAVIEQASRVHGRQFRTVNPRSVRVQQRARRHVQYQ